MECIICLDNGSDRIICSFPCNHTVCLNCLYEFNSHLCPMCRQDIYKYLPYTLTRIIDQNLDKKKYKEKEYLPDVSSHIQFPPLYK